MKDPGHNEANHAQYDFQQEKYALCDLCQGHVRFMSSNTFPYCLGEKHVNSNRLSYLNKPIVEQWTWNEKLKHQKKTICLLWICSPTRQCSSLDSAEEYVRLHRLSRMVKIVGRVHD